MALQFACTHVLKQVRTDHPDDGPAADRVTVINKDLSVVADSLPGLLAMLQGLYDLQFDALFIPDPDDVKSIAWNRGENDSGQTPTDQELDDWQIGIVKLFVAEWTFDIEAREVRPVSWGELLSGRLPLHTL